ncbi:DUF3016 domain-containing protein [Lysobacter sp. CA199]|uniref:DUF3016 domain-containing protein n=1 Tax=Lysobacter sp. CA199 TaxID=3455608 RepID=UPI003F8D6176
MHLRTALALILTAAVLAAGDAGAKSRTVTDPDAPRALPEQGPVSVRWQNPEQFTEIRNSRNRFEARRGNWVEQLAQYVRTRAQRQLPPGERLEVDITDIKRAGDFEPWHGPQFDDTRFVRDIYPPKIALSFKRLDASGQVIEEGQRNLRDMSFLMGPRVVSDSDPLRYEKRLIDDWLYGEFKSTDERRSAAR